MSESIRVIVLRDGEQWVAQCLEYDIATQGSTIDEARERLDVVVQAEIAESIARTGTPFGGLDPAPAEFHDMWENRTRSVEGSHSVALNGGAMNVEMAIAA